MLVVPVAAAYLGGVGSTSVAADSKTLDYTCDADAPLVGNMTVNMKVEVNGEAPETVEPGEEFNIENSYTNVTILDTSTMQIAMDEVTGQVTTFELSSDNLEKRINVAEEPLDIPATEFPDGSNEVTFQVPEEGLTVESFEAGNEGTIEISAGTIENTLESDFGPIDAVCHPDDDDTVVNTIEIEDDGNGGDPEPNPEEEALDAVNEADDAEEMQEALNNDDLGLDLSEFDELTEAEQAEVADQMLENRPGDGFTDANAVKEALEEAISAVTEERDEQGNGDNPEEEALQAVNEAETVDELWDALENEDLELNLSNTENYNTYRKTKAAEHIKMDLLMRKL